MRTKFMLGNLKAKDPGLTKVMNNTKWLSTNCAWDHRVWNGFSWPRMWARIGLLWAW